MEALKKNNPPARVGLSAIIDTHKGDNSTTPDEVVLESIAMTACPKYQSCNAPVCPLHPNWQNARHIPGERVCFYLLEAQKIGAKAIFNSVGRGELYRVMVEATPDISAWSGTIKITLAKAKKTGSRMSTKPPRSKSSVGGAK